MVTLFQRLHVRVYLNPANLFLVNVGITGWCISVSGGKEYDNISCLLAEITRCLVVGASHLTTFDVFFSRLKMPVCVSLLQHRRN